VESGIQVGGPGGPALAELAQFEASVVASDCVEIPHILLALLAGPNLARRALVSPGVTRESIEAAVLRIVVVGVREERHEIDLNLASLCAQSGFCSLHRVKLTRRSSVRSMRRSGWAITWPIGGMLSRGSCRSPTGSRLLRYGRPERTPTLCELMSSPRLVSQASRRGLSSREGQGDQAQKQCDAEQ
jgi:hypothetical protein